MQKPVPTFSHPALGATGGLGKIGAFTAALQRRAPLNWPESTRVYEGDLVVEGSTKRYAIVSTITDNFVGLGAAFLLSLHERLSNRDDVDVILLQSWDVAPLGLENGILLEGLCPGLKIIDVDTSSFLNAANMRRYSKDGKPISVHRDTHELPSKKAAYVKLNVLRFTQYEKVLLMDSDMMVMEDFSEVFELPHDLAAVPTGKADLAFAGARAPRGATGIGFINTGFLLMNPRLLGEKPFNAALDFLDQKRNRRLRDQSILNHIFRHAEKLLLPHAYNHKLVVSDPTMLSDPETLRSAKIIHFVALTKWALKDPARAGEPIYDHFHALQARTGMPFTLEP